MALIAVLENYSRCVLASSVSLTQDTTTVLRVFYSAVERYGPPERLVTDGGGIFKAKQSKAVYHGLGIKKEQIERRKSYQSYIETTFGIQKRMADWHFARAETLPELAEAHDAWREDYNAQRHWAHVRREDGRRSPRDVLGFYTALLRHREEDLRKAFSRPAPPASWTLWGTPGSWTGGSTARRSCPGGRWTCGCSRRA